MSSIQERFGLFERSAEDRNWFEPVDPGDLEEFWGESSERFTGDSNIASGMAHSYAQHVEQPVILVGDDGECFIFEPSKYGVQVQILDLSHQEQSPWDIFQKGLPLVENEHGELWPLLVYEAICDRKLAVILDALRAYQGRFSVEIMDEYEMSAEEVDELCEEINGGLYVKR